MKHLAYSLLFLLPGLLVFGQAPKQARFYHLSANDESNRRLSQASNEFIYQDSRGLIWISSIDGLHCFNGSSTQSYKPSPGTPGAIPDKYIQGTFVEDQEDNLWFSTYAAGISCFERKHNTFKTYPIYDGSKKLTNYFLGGKDENDRLWVICNDQLHFFDLQSHQYEKHKPILLRPNTIRGTLQSTTNDSLPYRFFSYTRNEPGLRITSVYQSGEIHQKDFFAEKQALKIHFVLPVSDTIAWLASDQGLVKFNLQTGQTQMFNNFEDQIITPVTSVQIYDNQTLIVASANAGILFFDLTTKRFTTQFTHQNGSPYSLAGNAVRNLYIDKNHNIWIAIDRIGIDYYNPDNIRFEQLLTSEQSGTEPVSFNSIIETKERNIWAGSYKQGVFILDPATRKVKHRLDTPELPSNAIIQLLEDREGKIWILTWRGLCFFDPVSRKIETLHSRDRFHSMIELEDGTLLLSKFSADGGGFWKVVNKQPIDLQSAGQIDASKDYLGLYQGRDGRLYAGEQLESINIYDPKKDFDLIGQFPIQGDWRSIYESPADNIFWIGTNLGLVRWDQTKDSIYYFTEQDGLPNSTIYSVLPCDHSLLLSSNYGIIKFDTSQQTSIQYGVMDGISALEFNTNGYLVTSDNEIWYASSDGISTTNCSRLSIPLSPPIPQVNNISINDEPLKKPASYSQDISNVSEIQQLKLLHYQERTLSFGITAVGYSGVEKYRLRYRLLPEDRDWIYTDQNVGLARYSKLKFGAYIFEVEALDAMGVPGKVKKAIQIYIPTPWWQTWWFYLLASISSLFLIGFFINRYYQRQAAQKRIELEKKLLVEQERTRIARDLHEDLGSGIFALMLRIEASLLRPVKEWSSSIKDLKNEVKQLGEKVSEVIWVIKSENDTIENLFAHLHRYATDLFSDTSISCTFNLPEELSNELCSGQIRRELFLVFKEALNNIVKYAQTPEVIITCTTSESTLTIQITDFGIGFDVDHPKHGNGLANMRHRMDKLGGSFSIHSSSSGTTISLQLPL